MGKDHRGQPSGTNKSEGSGVPNKISPDANRSEEQTEKYTNEAGELADNIPVRHPNRNTDKDIDDGPPYS